MLSLGASAAFAMNTQSAPLVPVSAPAVAHQTDTAATAEKSAPIVPSTSIPPTLGYFASLSPDDVRQTLAANGIDPDSERGRTVARWVVKYARDPEMRAARMGQLPTMATLWAVPFPAADRLRIAALLKDISSDPANSANNCRTPAFLGSDLMAFAKAASARTFDDLMTLLEIASANLQAQPAVERYTTAELLDADASMAAVPVLPAGTPGYPAGACGNLVYTLDTLAAMPEPTRQRTSWEFFRALNRRPQAFQTVLANPAAWLDATFDERALPAPLRQQLPADGSRPLPFTRIVVDAQWINKDTPSESAPFQDVLLNRRDNGVIAELNRSKQWAEFTLNYGLATLREQVVDAGSATTRLATLQTPSTLDFADRAPAPGEQIDIVEPQPSASGAVRHCVAQAPQPAARVFPSFEGEAIGLQCSRTNAHGGIDNWHTTWLRNYGIFWTDTIDDADGHTVAVIRKVTIEPAPH